MNTYNETLQENNNILDSLIEVAKKLPDAITDAVRTSEQELSEDQKTQARTNIGAASADDVHGLSQEIEDKVSKTVITLGLHSDGKYYIFVDGAPVGTGFELSGNGGDVFGYVDENNNIVLNGNLTDGSYNIKYEMEDGSTVDIGNLVLDSNVYYSVTNNLTNCTNSNSDTQAIGGQAYTATITTNSGYELSSVVVTMGGTDVTADVYSDGAISIASVTGDIVITAEAEEAEATPSYTNVLPRSTEADGTPFNGGLGYKTGYRLSVSAGGESASEGCEVTGYISVKQGDVVRVKNITLSSSSDGIVLFFDSNKTKLDSNYTADLFATDEGNGVYASAPITKWANLGYIRFASSNIDDTSIVTINEEIV